MDSRPAVWIGHAVLTVRDVDRSADYWQGLGMREVERNEHVAVLELRGGTHLVLVPGSPPDDAETPFDLMSTTSTRPTPTGRRAVSTRRRSSGGESTPDSRSAIRTATA